MGRSAADQAFLQACAEGNVDEVRRLMGPTGDSKPKKSRVGRVLSALGRGKSSPRGSDRLSFGLHIAAASDSVDVVALLLESGVPVDAPDDEGDTPLLNTLLAQSVASDAALALLEAGANPLARRQNRCSTLYLACERGANEVVKALIKRGANVDDTGPGLPVLGIAIAKAQRATVQILLEAGADISATDGDGDSMLLFALMMDPINEDIIRTLVHRRVALDARRESNGATALHLACQKSLVNVIDMLLDAGADPSVANSADITAPQLAVLQNDASVLKVLTRHGVIKGDGKDQGMVQHVLQRLMVEAQKTNSEIVEGPSKVLLLAISSSNVEMIKSMVAENKRLLEPEDRSTSPLHAACVGGHTSSAVALIEAGANIESLDDDGDTALLACVLIEQPAIGAMEALIAAGADVNAQRKNGSTALLVACERGWPEPAKILLNAGAKIDLPHNGGRSPLFVALFKGNDDIVQLLLRRGADTNLVDAEGDTPLLATMLVPPPSIKNVELLLDSGADVDARRRNGCTSLFIACQKGYMDVARLLVARGASPVLASVSGTTPLIIAAGRGNVEAVEMLLELKGVDPNAIDNDGDTALLSATMCPGLDVKVIELLLEHGARLEATRTNGSSALHIACEKGHVQMTRMLLDRSASLTVLDSDGDTPILSALLGSAPNTEVVRLCLEGGASPDTARTNGATLLGISCSKGQLEIARLLLERGASLVAEDDDGDSPLIVSMLVSNPSEDGSRLLVNAGADINVKRKNGCSVLYIAAEKGMTSLVKLLMVRGANLDQANVNGLAALHIAVAKNRPEIVRMLLDYGASVDLADNTGDTPLFYTVLVPGVDPEIVRMLWEAGADLDTVRQNGCTALFVACELGHSETARVLLDCGADPTIRSSSGVAPLLVAQKKKHMAIAAMLKNHGEVKRIVSRPSRDAARARLEQLKREAEAENSAATAAAEEDMDLELFLKETCKMNATTLRACMSHLASLGFVDMSILGAITSPLELTAAGILPAFLRVIDQGLAVRQGRATTGAAAAPVAGSMTASGESKSSEPHLFISYSWSNQSKALLVRQALKEAGARVWMDVDDMAGHINQRMAEAVEGATVVLVCVSQAYQASANCKKELEYAEKLGKAVIQIKVEEFEPTGWLGLILGNTLWYSISSAQAADNVRELRNLVGELIRRGLITTEQLSQDDKGTGAQAAKVDRVEKEGQGGLPTLQVEEQAHDEPAKEQQSAVSLQVPTSPATRRASSPVRAPSPGPVVLDVSHSIAATWSMEEVGQCLEDLALGRYAQTFIDEAVDGKLFLTLTDEDLKVDLGITSGIHRRKILTRIAELLQ